MDRSQSGCPLLIFLLVVCILTEAGLIVKTQRELDAAILNTPKLMQARGCVSAVGKPGLQILNYN